jgi:glycosidase
MIYNGQEVGETASGAAGFSGDDGRTTIFDYYVMPEHQKWMNDGQFDGANLSETQKALRAFYKTLINISISNEAIKEGRFYDLMYANTHETLPCRDKIFAWLRYTENQKLLCVVNFDKELHTSIRIRIPDHAFETMEWGNKSVIRVEGLMNADVTEELLMNSISSSGIIVKLSGYDAVMFQLA